MHCSEKMVRLVKKTKLDFYYFLVKQMRALKPWIGYITVGAISFLFRIRKLCICGVKFPCMIFQNRTCTLKRHGKRKRKGFLHIFSPDCLAG